jgi:hypothetical protein
LNSTLPYNHSDEKEASHVQEEEEEDDEAGSRKVTTPARASHWGRAVDFGIREAPERCFVTAAGIKSGRCCFPAD